MITATRIAKGRAVTVAINGMAFYTPVQVGSVVSCYTEVLEVGRSDVKALFGPEHDLNCYAIRSDLDVTDGFFAMMLVGKDGAVKFRTDEVVPASVLFELIDQMPLTQTKRSN